MNICRECHCEFEGEALECDACRRKLGGSIRVRLLAFSVALLVIVGVSFAVGLAVMEDLERKQRRGGAPGAGGGPGGPSLGSLLGPGAGRQTGGGAADIVVRDCKESAWIPSLIGTSTIQVAQSFPPPQDFETGPRGRLELSLGIVDNRLVLASSTSVSVAGSVLAASRAGGSSECEHRVDLHDGEITIELSQAGRERLTVVAGPLVVEGATGRYKIIRDRAADRVEVVVKNGLVKVALSGDPSSQHNVTGFYRILCEKGVLGSPLQAAIITYNWH